MKKVKKKIISASLSVIAILLVVVVGAVLLSKYYSQEAMLERIFTYRANMELDKYYSYFDIPEKSECPFNSLDAYLDSAEFNKFEKIDSFEVKKKSTNTYIVSYGDKQETLELVKQSKKALGLFDTYKIKIESVSEPLLYFVTLHNADVVINGTSLDNSYKVNEGLIEKEYDASLIEDGVSFAEYERITPITYFEYYDDIYDNYCFVNVFDNEYDITVTTDYTLPYEDTLTPSEEPYILREFKLNDENEIEIKELGESFIQKYYYALQDGEDFDAVKYMLSQNEETLNFFENDYNELYDIFTRGELTSGLSDICFLESTANIIYPNDFALNQNEFTILVTLTYSYNSISYDGYLDEYEHHNDMFDECTIQLECIKEEGKWVITDALDTLVNIIY
ncbi:MAG: hypothetical protein IJP16_07595 [Clostridia bacterium]|nr:hypothetical protein [Clostridia bacterium]